MSNITENTNRDLVILEHIEQDPDATQATLASQLGVAVGTINWHLKRLVEKGYVKVRRAERRKLRYIITPEGLALRAQLTINYIQNSFEVYRLVRSRMIEALGKVHSSGEKCVCLVGEGGDVDEICRLTCLEQGFSIVENHGAPRLVIRGLKIIIAAEEDQNQ